MYCIPLNFGQNQEKLARNSGAKLWSEWILQRIKEKSTSFNRPIEIRTMNTMQDKESKQKLKNI